MARFRMTNTASDRSPSRWTLTAVIVAVVLTVATRTIVQFIQTRNANVSWQGSQTTLKSDHFSQSMDTDPFTVPAHVHATVPAHVPATVPATAPATVAPDFQLAFEQSLGFFDNIPNDLWISYYQDRARKAEHYRWSKTPNKGAVRTHHWNFFNWDP
jgi:hypothetical protein